MYEMVVLLPNSEHTKGNNMKYHLRDADARTIHLCPYGPGQAIQDPKALFFNLKAFTGVTNPWISAGKCLINSV